MSENTNLMGDANEADVYDISGNQPVLGKISHDELGEALASGKFSLPKGAQVEVASPDGERGTMDAAEVGEALKNGYTYVKPADLKQEKYGTIGQQALAGLEGFGRGVIGPLAPALQQMTGLTTGEDIRAREEVNPITAGLGDVAGFGLGLLSGASEAGLAAKGLSKLGPAGEAIQAASKFTMGPITTELGKVAGGAVSNKIGSEAAKLATEFAFLGTSHELSKLVTEDPDQSMGSAMANIGLNGLLGAGIGSAVGVVSPLWKASVGPKLDSMLGGLKTKLGGIEGQTSDTVNKAIENLGIDVAPEIRAAVSNNKQLQVWAKTLEETDINASGIEYQKALKGFKESLNNSVLESMGRTADNIPGEFSKFQDGALKGEILAKEFNEKLGNAAEVFEKRKQIYNEIPLEQDIVNKTVTQSAHDLTGLNPIISEETAMGSVSRMQEGLTKLARDEGWLTYQDSEIMQKFNKVMKNLPEQQTLKDLSGFISQVGNDMYNPLDKSLTRAGALIKNVLREEESNLVLKAVGEREGAEALAQFKGAKDAWSAAGRLQDELNESLNIKGGSVGGYAKRIMEMAKGNAETLSDRLSGKGDAALLNLLKEHFPATAEAVKQSHIEKLLYEAGLKPQPGMSINPNKLFEAVTNSAKMPPELRDFVLSPEVQERIMSAKVLTDHLKQVADNTSNTARALMRQNANIPTNVGAAAAMLSGHPYVGGILGIFGKALTRDTPDAIRLGLLKFLGSSKPIDSGAFKASVELIDNIIKGEAAINKVSSALLKSSEAIPSKIISTDKEVDKLDKKLEHYRANPVETFDVGSGVGAYMPEHSAVASGVAVGAVEYLNSLKPKVPPGLPLDAPMKNPIKEGEYRRALSIAVSPLSIVKDIKEGTILPQDIVTLNKVAPGLYNRLVQKFTDGIIDNVADGIPIPYKTRIGLSMFMGTPLDSTFKPESIIAAQPKMEQRQEQEAAKIGTGNMAKLDKLPGLYRTPGQAREANKSKV